MKLKYFKIAIVSIAGQLISLAIAFLFQFIAARKLGTALYGELSIILGVFSILSIPSSSFQVILGREISKLEAAKKEENINFILRKYFLASILFGLPSSIVLALTIFLLNIYTHSMELGVILVSVPFCYAVLVLNAYFQGKQKAFEYSAITVLTEALRLVFCISLVYLGLGIMGVTLGYMADMLLLAAGGYAYIRVKCTPVKHTEFSIKKNLSLILPTNIILTLMIFTDIFAVKHFLGADQTGIYNAASVLAKIIFFTNVGLMAAFLPQSSRISAKKDKTEVVKTAATTALLLLPLLIILLLAGEYMITAFFGEAYSEASFPLQTLSIAMYVLALSLMLINLLWSQNEEKLPLEVASVGFLANLILLSILVPKWGIIGAAKANLLSECLLLVLTLLAVRKTTR